MNKRKCNPKERRKKSPQNKIEEHHTKLRSKHKTEDGCDNSDDNLHSPLKQKHKTVLNSMKNSIHYSFRGLLFRASGLVLQPTANLKTYTGFLIAPTLTQCTFSSNNADRVETRKAEHLYLQVTPLHL